MALATQALKNGIRQLMNDMRMREENSDDEYATRLASLIESFVKSGTVKVNSGIAVTTSGTATTQTGATTALGTGTIS